MNMDLGELRSFVVLAETLHFGRAAKALHITQPALTKQIKRLESKLDGVLFARRPSGTSLTAAGEVLRDAAARLLRDADGTEQAVRMAMAGRAGRLRIGFGIASLAAGLARIVRDFQESHPHVQLSLRDMSTPAQLAALEQGGIDVGFVRLPVDSPGIASAPVLSERLMLALPSSYEPEKRRARSLSAFKDSPFVIVTRAISTSYYDHVIRTCNAAGFSPRVVQEVTELFTALHLVGAGIGVALVPGTSMAMRVPHVRFADTGITEARWEIGGGVALDAPAGPARR
jgi:DNA-binding transcriptional LysR family regulator